MDILNNTDKLINELRKKDIQFAPGLTEERLREIETKLNGILPDDLRQLLSKGVPIAIGGDYDKFPRWDLDINDIVANSRAFVIDALQFDIKENGYWCDIFDDKPDSDESAVQNATGFVKSLPSLVPVFGHRFVISGQKFSPVISYSGPLDTIIYAENIAEYFHIEFGIPNYRALIQPNDHINTPWSKILSL